LIDSAGAIAGRYRKTHLWGAERDAFTVGSELEPITLGESSVGLMICFDVEFPEVARTLAARGADLLVTISANMAPFGPDHDLASRARALENGVPHLYANRVGAEAGLEFVGESRAVNPWGRITVAAGGDPCELEVTAGHAGAADPRLNYAGQLRPELYQLLSA
jgi:predicted amidohydrolase